MRKCMNLAPMPNDAINWLFAGGGLIAIGAGIKWLYDKFFERLDKREAAIEQKEEAHVSALKERVTVLEALVSNQGEELRRLTLGLGILIAKEQKNEPDSIELKQVMNIIATGNTLGVKE